MSLANSALKRNETLGQKVIYGSQMQKGTYSPKGEAPEKVVLT